MTELRYALRGKDVDMMWYCLRCNKLSPTDAVGVQNRKDNGGADKMGTESCVMNISPTYHTIYFRVPYHVCQLVCVFGHDGDHMMRWFLPTAGQRHVRLTHIVFVCVAYSRSHQFWVAPLGPPHGHQPQIHSVGRARPIYRIFFQAVFGAHPQKESVRSGLESVLYFALNMEQVFTRGSLVITRDWRGWLK